MKMFLELIFIGAIMICTFLLMFASSTLMNKMLVYVNRLSELTQVIAWLIFTRTFSILTYIWIMQYMSLSNAFETTIMRQLVLVIIPFASILIIDTLIDFQFCKKHFAAFPIEARKSIIKKFSFLTKIVVTIFLTFVLGIKSTAYDIAKTYSVDIFTIFVIDLLITYLATTLACFDIVLEYLDNN